MCCWCHECQRTPDELHYFAISLLCAIVDHHFIAMGPIRIGFYFIFATYCLLLFFLWVVSTCAFDCLVLLMDGFQSLIFIYRVFLLVFFLYAQRTHHPLDAPFSSGVDES